jgi:hypothetical protein
MTLRTLFLASLFISGCTAEVFDQPARGPIGKADLVGSCSLDDCGGPSASGSCWCDDACATYGDCCADKSDVCEPDAHASCGGFAGLACGDGEYCHYQDSDGCGFADATGTCLPTPDACAEVFLPVCGCDGQTYGNECEAHAAGASVLHAGACDQPTVAHCGGLAGLACGDGEYCAYDVDQSCGAADQLGTCATRPEVCFELFAPVCGCDGQTYSNSCFASSAGTSVVHDGACD